MVGVYIDGLTYSQIVAFSVSGFVNKLIDQLNSESMDGLDDYAYNRLMDILVICFVIAINYIPFFILFLVWLLLLLLLLLSSSLLLK